MDISTFLIIITVFYGVLLFFDTFFKTCAHYPYIQFLQGTGLEVKFFRLNWQTKFFNRILVRWGSAFTKFSNLWFNTGTYVSLLLLPFAFILLLIITCQVFIKTEGIGEKISFQPVIPGVNLPVTELGFYIVSLTICSVVHELGHALAAVNEDVHIEYVGLFIIFIVPIAYINLTTEKLLKIGPWAFLRIFCAGVWHNIVLAAFCWILYCNLPHFFSLFYYVNNGIIITDIGEKSPLAGSRGLHKGDIVTKINDCLIRSAEDFNNCLLKSREQKLGFCVDSDLIHSLDESVQVYQSENGILNCCNPRRLESICFEYIGRTDGVTEIPPHICLPARRIVEKYDQFCSSVSMNCPKNLHCIQPILSNFTYLFSMKRLSRPNVIYIGHYSDIFNTVEVSSFIPRIFFESAVFPMVVMKLLMYLVVFSLGLAIVNLIPCFFMDGQHIVKATMQLILPNNFDKDKINAIIFGIVLVGTLLFCLNCFISIWKLF